MAEGGKDHRKKKSGRKADKRKAAETKKKGDDGGNNDAARKQNPKAFIFKSRGKAKIQRARTAEKDQRRMHVPAVEKNVEEPPPFTILVQGPPGVGKSTLIKCLIKHYTRQDVRDAKGPVTVVAGKTRRLTFIECPQDLNGMIDAAKYADLVLLLIDGAFGFEMETFEFLNILQVHGFPKVMGVLTHLDGFKDVKALKKTKKALKHRFWSEIYPGAKLFYLSGIKNGKYLHREVHNLARFVSVMKFRPLQWRQSHPFLLADRVEDVTPAEAVRQNPRCDRDISLYGYIRGTNWKEGVTAHIAGVGDFKVTEAVALPDPCPLPGQMKRRTLNEKERLIYAPMSDIGGLLYDKDAMYIDIPDWKMQFSHASVLGNRGNSGTSNGDVDAGEGEAMVRGLQGTKMAVDEKIKASRIQLFAGGKAVSHADVDGWEASARKKENGGFISEENEDSESSDDEEEGEEESGDGGGSSDDEDGDADADGVNRRKGQGPEEHQVVHSSDGRVRRRAIFPGGSAAAAGVDEDEDEEKNEHGGQKSRKEEKLRYDDDSEEDKESSEDGEDSEDSESESESHSEEDEGLGGAAKWKGAMLQRASALFSARAADLQEYIYGTRATADENNARGRGEYEDGSEDDDDDDELFRPKKGRNSSFRGNNGNNADKGKDDDVFNSIDAADCSRADVSSGLLTKWAEPDAAEELRNRFVTGDWDAGAARAAARPGEDSESDDGGGDDKLDGEDEVFGDFEDLETGEKFAGSSDPATRAAAAAIKAAEVEEDLAAKRAAKKAAFNAEYDESGGAKGIKDALSPEAAAAAAVVGGKGGKRGKSNLAGEDDDEETYYDAMKRDMSERAERTKTAMDALDPVQRVIMEGHRPGAYVRLRFTGIPCELMENFDPRQPILIGGLGRGEETPGYMQLRLKRHRWFPKILKNRDPLIFSIGWRRFQSLPVFAIKDNNERHRMLKYSPEHMHCLAAIYGPLAPPGTGILAIQKTTSGVSHWRVAATGVVLQLDASLKVVKKLKLVGTPFKIHRHTAFVNGMFNSQLEAAKFEGASIRTVSGIRGTIKKAVRVGTQSGARDGAYRATFEDKPLLSDVVFLRAWVEVDIPKFSTPVTNLLAPPNVEGVKRKPKPFSKNRPKPEEDTNGGDEPYVLENGVPRIAAPLVEELDRKYLPAFKFNGAKAGYVFTTGKQGLGYYEDLGRLERSKGTPAAAAAKTGAISGDGADASQEQQNEVGIKDSGWVGMRSVADLRREASVGAPRNSDSLYKPIERKKRVFNPLRVPTTLQAALPFKTKPKLEAKRKRKSLEQRRAVVVEPEERKAMSLVAQLNAIRNAKAVGRRDQKARHAVKQAKAAVAEEEWRAAYNKEERKKRYVERGHAEKKKAKRARGD